MSFKSLIQMFFCLLLFQGCSVLPKKPQKISIYISTSGGMLPDYSQINIDNDSCRIKRSFRSPSSNQQQTEEYSFSVSENELRSLYQIFIDNSFDRIREKKEEVFDRGGVSVTLTVDGKTINKADGGNSFILEKDREKFNSILSAVHKFISDKKKSL